MVGPEKSQHRTPILDENQKLSLVRRIEDITPNGDPGIENGLKPPVVQKKRINIPIGDVKPDQE